MSQLYSRGIITDRARHVWVQEGEIGISVAFDKEPTEEELGVFRDLCRWLDTPEGRESLRRQMGRGMKLTVEEAAEPGDAQVRRIDALRRRAGLDQ